ncbi:MAG: hypothetical protein F9B45_07240 [Phycisphaera sp. RhM]|nr:hypothetical protein [Phycisphaera sp. RhM]
MARVMVADFEQALKRTRKVDLDGSGKRTPNPTDGSTFWQHGTLEKGGRESKERIWTDEKRITFVQSVNLTAALKATRFEPAVDAPSAT